MQILMIMSVCSTSQYRYLATVTDTEVREGHFEKLKRRECFF